MAKSPLEQLLDAGKKAQKVLEKDPLSESGKTITSILEDPGAPTLPGVPPYLPNREALQGAQRVMQDLVIVWMKDVQDHRRANNISLFIEFCLSELHLLEKKINKEIVNQPNLVKSMKGVPVMKDVFAPIRKKKVLKAMSRFIVDSFNVSVVVRQHHSVVEFLDWFGPWTKQLETLWERVDKQNAQS